MIIGLLGLIGSGKNTAGNIISKYGYQQISFADKIKDLLVLLFGWDKELLDGNTIESRNFRNTIDIFWAKKLNIPNFTPRYAMQFIGSDLMRNCFYDKIWIDSLFCSLQPNVNYVITDVRFSIEIKEILNHNGILIRIKRGDDPQFIIDAREKSYYKITEHQSEWNWVENEESLHYLVENNSDIISLENKLKLIVEKINV